MATTTTPAAAPVSDALPSLETTAHNIDQHYDLAIRIKVGRGNGAQEFDIYRGMLKFYSGYFRTAIQNIDDGKFAEAATGVIELPDEEVDTFRIFKRWLYAPNRKLDANAISDFQALSYITIFKLWCFAERRIIPLLQNRAIDLIIFKVMDKDKPPISWRDLRYAFENSAAGSNLRELLTFVTMSRVEVEGKEEELRKETKKAWFQEWSADVCLLRILKATTKDYDKCHRSRCFHHEHEKGVECADNKSWFLGH